MGAVAPVAPVAPLSTDNYSDMKVRSLSTKHMSQFQATHTAGGDTAHAGGGRLHQ